FTQRTLGQLTEATVYAAAERRGGAGTELDEAGDRPLGHPDRLGRCDVVWHLDEAQRAAEEELGSLLELGTVIRLDALPAGQPHTFEGIRPAIAARGLAEAERDLAGLERAGNRVVVAFQHRGEALRTRELVRRIEPRILEPSEPLPDDAGVSFVVSPARRGFVSRELRVALLPDAQVFRRRSHRARQATRGRSLQSFSDLRGGDHVVHEDHGIGQLIGFETKTVADVTRDYLFLAFKGDDRLYVPHEQIGKVSRYIGGDASAPSLSRLGGKAWQLIKTRARSGVRELAGELLELYARRQTAEGVAYDTGDELVEALEASFPYQETADQRQAIEAVKEDMESARPMDRLVCGDVGFGKTEVAIRAAFVAAVGGRQTLVLAPTTVLAQQHFNSFRERYADLPVTVELVSRFRRAAQVKGILARFEAGEIDVLIGTHRLLSRDVLPKRLGLAVVDEEQRFGVAQKELLRQLRREIEVLAMSATPIPRTLHMSLAGLRDISVIETPPEGRRPIRTHVGEYSDEE
ncbi:MAG: DEAD/DEAH box helicase, partial [Gaiellales bacterium]